MLHLHYVPWCFLPLTFHSNNHIQDVLVVSYLANTVRTQMELSTRLATAQLTLGGGGEGPATGDQRNQRGGKGNNQGGRPRQDRTEETRA